MGDRFTGIQAGIAIPLWFAPYTAKTKAAKIKQQVASTNAEYYSKSLSGNYQALLSEYGKFNKSLEFYEKQAIPEADIIIEQASRITSYNVCYTKLLRSFPTSPLSVSTTRPPSRMPVAAKVTGIINLVVRADAPAVVRLMALQTE